MFTKFETFDNPQAKGKQKPQNTDRPYPTPEPFSSVNQEHCLVQQKRPLNLIQKYPKPRSTAGSNGGKASESAASQQLAKSHRQRGPQRIRARSPSTLGPCSPEAARTFWRHQLVQQNHSEDSSGKAQRGVAQGGGFSARQGPQSQGRGRALFQLSVVSPEARGVSGGRRV